MFPSGSSSSLLNTYIDVEAFEVSAKTRSSNDKEVHEIIDVDVEEDSDDVIQKTSRKVSQFEATWFPRKTRSCCILSTSSKSSKRPAAGVQINNNAGGKKGKISSEYNVGHKKFKISSANGGGYSTPATQEFPQVKNQDSSKNVDEILQKYDNFKKFDIVDDFPDHYFRTKDPARHGSDASGQMWARKIQQEWRILEKSLPDKIFVRVCESRMDLMRAVIIGAEGTPYHDGLFFFDVFFPSRYPSVPPSVYYHLHGGTIHPNIPLYIAGKVCMSLLTTRWPGGGNWIPHFSTILQVLVSIQGLIFTAKPYLGINGHAIYKGLNMSAAEFNENTFLTSLFTMGIHIRRPLKHFEEFVAGHFCKYGGDILVLCKAYLDGAQVGTCLVRGGIVIQDVDEGDTSSSKQFRARLLVYVRCLANEFSQLVGATSGTPPYRTKPISFPSYNEKYRPLVLTPMDNSL